jgi:putative transposase
VVTPPAQRNAVAHLMSQHGMSERRACKTIGFCRMTMRYETRRSDDQGLRERMKALAHERRRFGYRRIHALLRREGHRVNHKKLFRLYREEKLSVRKRGGRKRAIGARAPMLIPMVANDRWSLDFVSDQFTDGRRFRILTVVDDCARECLALVADTSLSGLRVARELDRIIEKRGKPKMIVSDNGSEFTSNFILQWTDRAKWMALHCPRQADPERVHRKLQRTAPRRAFERNSILVTGSCSVCAFELAQRLQRPQTAFRPRLADACRIRTDHQPAT